MSIDMGVIVAGAIMIAAFTGLLVCAKAQRTHPRAQTYAIILLVVVLSCGFHIIIETGGDDGVDIENELAYAKVSTLILGRHLGGKFIDKKALIIAGGNHENDRRQQKLIEGLKEGFAGRITDVLVDSPKWERQPGDGEMINPGMMEMMSAKMFDAVIRENRGRDLIISLIGLPYDAADMEIWRMPAGIRPKLALAHADIHALKKVIAKGAVTAAVNYRPGCKFTPGAPPDDPDEAFGNRYLLVTEENVREVAASYPDLFMRE